MREEEMLGKVSSGATENRRVKERRNPVVQLQVAYGSCRGPRQRRAHRGREGSVARSCSVYSDLTGQLLCLSVSLSLVCRGLEL